jgi:signal transduction histidine kinase
MEGGQLDRQAHECREDFRRLSRQLMQWQEDYRKAVARDVHDELGQIFTALKFSLAALERAEAARIPFLLPNVQAQLHKAMDKLRQWAFRLRPSVLDDLGLWAAAQWQAGYCARELGLEVRLIQKGLDGTRFGEEVEINVYRVLQEALTNVARHAATDRATVELRRSDHQLGLVVRDKGRGFNPDEQDANGTDFSRGVRGMRERAEAMGGRLSLVSAPGRGTCLTMEVPLAGKLNP